jgi:hypothetical protein
LVPVQASRSFPPLALRTPEGEVRALASLWQEGVALVLVGHCDCKTTRQTLPYVDRIHRRIPGGASVTAILQDDPETVRGLWSHQKLELPVLLEEDPYPLAAALRLTTVPTLFLVDREGSIEKAAEGFNRAELESFAARLGAIPPLFVPEDEAPAFRPG